MVSKSDQLILELHFKGVEIIDHISLKEGNYLTNLKRVVFEAFNDDEDFKALVPNQDDWSRVVLQ